MPLTRSGSKKCKVANYPSLPHEVLVDILLRLPAKSLKRLSSVLDDVQRVKNSIQNPNLVKKHAFNMVNNPDQKQLLIQSDEMIGRFTCIYLNSLPSMTPEIASPSVSRVNYKLLGSLHRSLFDEGFRKISVFTYQHPIIIGASHGLICFALEGYHHAKRGCPCCSNEDFNLLVIWNPFTKQHFTFPNPKPYLDGHTKFGFGYDSVNQTFNVVKGNGCSTTIYSLASNSWIHFDCINWDDCKVQQRGNFLEGALHWIASDNRIMALDLATKVSKYFDVPDDCSFDSDHTAKLGVLGESLVLSSTRKSSEIGIWVMKEYGNEESWTKMYTLEEPECVPLLPPFWSFENKSLLFNVECKLALWPQGAKKFVFDRKKTSVKFREGIIHVDTLVSPNPDDGTNRSKANVCDV